MRREHVAVAVIGARDLSIWGTPTFGVDYDPLLGAYLSARRRHARRCGTSPTPWAAPTPRAASRSCACGDRVRGQELILTFHGLEGN